MAVSFKDYYAILGVARTASDDEIKKAFRKLAREFHPDVAKNKKTAEEKFKEINEAYEVLSDPAKRKKYDELGANWKSGAEFRPPPGWGGTGGRPANGRGQTDGFEFEFGGTGFSDFFEQLFGRRGRERGGGFGSGMEEEAGQFEQRGRDVEADILVPLEEVARGAVRAISLRRAVACEQCGGTGRQKQRPCARCGGRGQVEKTEDYKVKIPAGIGEGQRLRVAGRGEAGVGRGEAGDLFLRVRLAKHPDFRVADGDLFHDLELAPWEAVLGAQVAVPTLDGRVNIKIPAGTQSGQKLRVRDRGLPHRDGTRGDLFVVASVRVPEQVSADERRLWEELARGSRFAPREG